jgi:hypothetical protein
MKFQLHWIDNGQWRVSEVQSAETFEMYGFTFAIHRPVMGNPKTWCVTEVRTGASLLINMTGTKAQARDEACRTLGTFPKEQWEGTLTKLMRKSH